MVVNGSLSKTAVNGGGRRAKSQVSGLFVAVLTVVTLLFLTGLFEQLPEATLAAIVIAAVIELVDIDSLRRLYGVWSSPLSAHLRPGRPRRLRRRPCGDARRAGLRHAAGPVHRHRDLVPAAALPRLAPNIAILGRTPAAAGRTPTGSGIRPRTSGVVVLRVEGGLFFANADAIRERVVAAAVAPGRPRRGARLRERALRRRHGRRDGRAAAAR